MFCLNKQFELISDCFRTIGNREEGRWGGSICGACRVDGRTTEEVDGGSGEPEGFPGEEESARSGTVDVECSVGDSVSLCFYLLVVVGSKAH